jgi:hypothetical protein
LLRDCFWNLDTISMGWPAQNKNNCDKFNLIHVSISIGQSFAGGENGYAGAGKKRRVAWTQTLAEMPVVGSPAVGASPAPTLLQRFLPRGSSCRALDRTVSEVFRQGCLAI